MNPTDFYVNLKLRPAQLEAIRSIYYRYFEQFMQPYSGTGVIALWGENASWEVSKGADINHKNSGIVSDRCRFDPLWDEFLDLLPHMTPVATITRLPPGQVMIPHVDRKWRPEAIYFPIDGCSEECVSEYYALPKIDTENNQHIDYFPEPVFSYAINKSAVLTNVHEWHGVRNTSSKYRTAFGWNMKLKYSFNKCKEVLTELGYIDEIQPHK